MLHAGEGVRVVVHFLHRSCQISPGSFDFNNTHIRSFILQRDHTQTLSCLILVIQVNRTDQRPKAGTTKIVQLLLFTFRVIAEFFSRSLYFVQTVVYRRVL